MKKTNKRNILILIILIIFIIILLRAFSNSRANRVIEITANIQDNSGLLVDEQITLEAINEGESGFSITLPEVVNTKKVTKYMVVQKEMIENTEEETNSGLTNTTNHETTNATINQMTSDLNSGEDTNTIQVQQANTTSSGAIEKTSIVEKSPGEKIYLTQEERENASIILTVEYDKKEVKGETFYHKQLVLKDEDANENTDNNENITNNESTIDNETSTDNEILSVSGYMPYDTELEVTAIEMDTFQDEIAEKYPNYVVIEKFDIQLMSQETEYLAQDHDQTLYVEMIMPNQDKTYTILEIQKDTTQEDIQENASQKRVHNKMV